MDLFITPFANLPHPSLLLDAMAFLFGAVFGSFLNVCIVRCETNESIVFPGSHCPICKELLPARDNIPVLSYLMLKGKCRFCGTSISVQYPIVELLMAFTAMAIYHCHGPSVAALAYILLAGAMIATFMTDFLYMMIPDYITIPGIALGVFFSFFKGTGVTLRDSLIGANIGSWFLLVLGVVFFLIRGVEAIGRGDIKYMAMAGAFLGWRAALLILMLGSLIGTLTQIAKAIVLKENLRGQFAFGPYLVAGTAVVLLLGRPLIDWFNSIYRAYSSI